MMGLPSLFNRTSKEDKVLKETLKNYLGFSPSNISLYKQAFRHKSLKSEISQYQPSNERLEFLGDAILGAVIAEHLFKLYPKEEEGFLTQTRSKIVNGQSLLVLSKKFGFDVLLNAKIDKKDKISSSAYGDVFEAFIGAVFLDKGFDKTKTFILQNVVKHHVNITELTQTETDFKSKFQIEMQRRKKKFEYTVLQEHYVNREKLYVVQLSIDGEIQAEFEHKSKRVAEQRLAQITLEKMGII